LAEELRRAEQSHRQTGHLCFIAEFTLDIKHISGVDNVVADTLSRVPPAMIVMQAAGLPSTDYAELAAEQ